MNEYEEELLDRDIDEELDDDVDDAEELQLKPRNHFKQDGMFVFSFD